MAILVSASRALNGSSSSSKFGSRTSARASDARCASPPERVSGEAAARSVSADFGQSVAALARSGRIARRPQADVVGDALPRDEPRFLEGDRHRAVNGELAGDLLVEPGQCPQQGGLA